MTGRTVVERMRSSHLGRIGIGALLLASLSACNFFLPPPQMRSDRDFEAQLRNFHVVQVDSTSMEARLSWPIPPEWVDDWERVDKVHIVYQRGAPPISRTTLMPPPEGGVHTFFEDKSLSSVRWRINSVPKSGTELWFGMFAHSGRGWWAPVYDKLVVSNALSSQNYVYAIPNPSTYRRQIINYDVNGSSGSIYEVTAGPYTIDRSGGIYNSVLLEFDLPEDAEVLSADLSLQVNSVTGTPTIRVLPMLSTNYYQYEPLQVRQRLVDTEIESAAPQFTLTTGGNSLSITEVVRYAVLHSSNAIMLEIVNDTSSVEVDLSTLTEEIYLTYYSFE